ncbi:class I SAM-dependent methyltransferase [Paracoccus sp. p4-l81]|uniref:class I SAM-dependent methyltransferase n=1 Tax=Paracoccus sp. p4-l81 TaxID=3342806 RepID=UPI0035BB8E69
MDTCPPPSPRPVAPALTDRAALDRARARARRIGPALFLHDAAADEIALRLTEVNRTFTRIAIVAAFPEPWQAAFPGARIVADTQVLDLEPGAQDLVIHAMSLHWADDPVGQLVQCRQALRPDGLLIAVFPAGRSLHELRASLAEAEVGTRGGLSPRVLPMGEIRDLGGLLQRAGLALPVADSVPLRVSYRDLFHLARDLRAMGETNALSARPRHATRRALFAQAAAIYAANFPEADGRIAATFDLVFLTGWAPDPSQQQPMRPGSASHSLAAILDDLARDRDGGDPPACP